VEATDHPFAIGVQWEAGQTGDERLHRALAQAARRASPGICAADPPGEPSHGTSVPLYRYRCTIENGDLIHDWPEPKALEILGNL
jgi:hypothetical protein